MRPQWKIPSSPEEHALLATINHTLAAHGDTSEYLKLPPVPAGAEKLENRIIVMVDDVRGVLAAFIPLLMVASGGKAGFVHHQGQTVSALAEEIVAYNPEIVLVDYHLANKLKGTSVIRALCEQDFQGALIGFSSEKNAFGPFLQAGAKGSVEKNTGDPGASLTKLAGVF